MKSWLTEKATTRTSSALSARVSDQRWNFRLNASTRPNPMARKAIDNGPRHHESHLAQIRKQSPGKLTELMPVTPGQMTSEQRAAARPKSCQRSASDHSPRNRIGSSDRTRPADKASSTQCCHHQKNNVPSVEKYQQARTYRRTKNARSNMPGEMQRERIQIKRTIRGMSSRHRSCKITAE